MISKFLRVSVIMALGASSTQAGYLGEEGEIAAADPVYATDDAPDTISALTAILNARGGQGLQFRGLGTLNNAVPFQRNTSFIDDRSDTSTYVYQAETAITVPADFLSQINDRGAAGFEYVINYNASSGTESANIFEQREGTGETFEYRLPLSPTTQSNFLALLESQGAEGYLWLGIRALRTASGTLVRHQLFVKRSTETGTYTYRSENATSDGIASINQYNALGRSGFRWIFGTTIPGVSPARNIYVKSSTRPSNFSYNILEAPASRTEFVSQGNSEGAQGRYFKTTGQYNLNGVAQGASIFVSETPVLPSAGDIDIADNGQVIFIPLTSGSFQLQTSAGLQSWANSGAAQAGTAGSTVTFDTGAITGRRFFRVVEP